MATTFEAESTLTERYQTTVPETVRRALGLKKRDKIHYSIRPDGAVILTRAETAEEDPAVGQFLEFLEREIATNPQRLKVVDAEFVARLDALVGDVEIDLDQPLSADDE
ncbi:MULTISPECIES: type II toxin-antitoxin system PrlF family antitoxin [unclassified Pseudomonas]|uniref:type II toxin-antitoxin system PrlF family antitoxin n=1 Tax=unclassified Pseudomonas TaxID=196821 RepID=UPI001117DB82|nr:MULTISPECIES: type II toxin-antitoxin system PrlF family antitoxin [unclassified Pseudomonas]UVL20166.1 type II toxin-antitoxin system PrlF family antitoxin [Pseudomonas sp. B21-044]